MMVRGFIGGVLVAIGFGGIGLLLDAGSPTGIHYLQNDLIAIALVALFVGTCGAFLGSLARGPQ